MHAHWLPNIDDGAKSLDETLSMLRAFVDLGYDSLIATPHVMADYYPNTPKDIRERLEEVRELTQREGLPLTLSAAAEYMIDDQFEAHMAEHGLLTLPGNRLLIEFGFLAAPAGLDGVLFRLQAADYTLVIAHPERYTYFHQQPAVWRQFHDRGIKLQVNVLSLVGHYGSRVQSVAQQLVKEGLVSMIGTDAHHTDHLRAAAKVLKNRKVASLLAKSVFDNKTLVA